MIKKIVTIGTSTLTMLALTVVPAFAHAVMKPSQVGVAAFQDFNLGVPSEKDSSTTSVRLLLPPGLNFVSPVVKPGWKVEVKSGPILKGMKAPVASDGDVTTTIPTEIDWTGGEIPAGQKDIFTFSAQVPVQETELDWKVYQGYADNSTVSWDLGKNDPQPKDSKGKIDFSSKGPYSKTMVVNDLNGSSVKDNTSMMQSKMSTMAYGSKLPLGLSVIAIILSIAALGLVLNKKK